MSTAIDTLQSTDTTHKATRRTVLGGVGLATAAFATKHATAAPAPMFAPSELGREAWRLCYELRELDDAQSDAEGDTPPKLGRRIDDAHARWDELTSEIYSRPLSPSAIVDRAIVARWHSKDHDKDLSGYLAPDSARDLISGEDPDNQAINGLVAIILAMAKLPLDWDDDVVSGDSIDC